MPNLEIASRESKKYKIFGNKEDCSTKQCVLK